MPMARIRKTSRFPCAESRRSVASPSTACHPWGPSNPKVGSNKSQPNTRHPLTTELSSRSQRFPHQTPHRLIQLLVATMGSTTLVRGFKVSVATLDAFLAANNVYETYGTPPFYGRHPDKD